MYNHICPPAARRFRAMSRAYCGPQLGARSTGSTRTHSPNANGHVLREPDKAEQEHPPRRRDRAVTQRQPHGERNRNKPAQTRSHIDYLERARTGVRLEDPANLRGLGGKRPPPTSAESIEHVFSHWAWSMKEPRVRGATAPGAAAASAATTSTYRRISSSTRLRPEDAISVCLDHSSIAKRRMLEAT